MCVAPAHAADKMKPVRHNHNIGHSSAKPLAVFETGITAANDGTRAKRR
jgi:hypothetical protein